MAESIAVLLDAGNGHRAQSKWESARETYEYALKCASRVGDATSVAEAVLLIAHVYREAGRLEEAKEQYDLAGLITDLTCDVGRAARSANGLGIVLQELGRIDDAGATYLQATVLASDSGDHLTLAHVHQNLGTLANIRGRQAEALAFYTTSIEYYRHVGDDRGVAGVLNNLAMLCIDRGDFSAAERHLAAAYKTCREIGDRSIESVVHLTSAELHLATHQSDQARHHCESALRLADLLNQDRIKADALRLLGSVEREDKSYARSEGFLLQSIGLCSISPNPLTEAEAHHELALLLQQVGRDKEALEALDRAYRIFGQLDARHDQSDVKRRIAHVESTFLTMVAAWGESIDSIDEYTRGHCGRVASYACMLGRRLGLSERDLFWIRIGALLHDVGKTAVPACVLLKRGPLSPAERAIVEEHPLHGVRLLSSITLPAEVRAMIRSHHERWDGAGYPDGLRGTEIPFFARLLTFADVFDALTSARSYRSAIPIADAIRLMREDTGLFDPELTSEFFTFAEGLTSLSLFPEGEPVYAGAGVIHRAVWHARTDP